MPYWGRLRQVSDDAVVPMPAIDPYAAALGRWDSVMRLPIESVIDVLEMNGTAHVGKIPRASMATASASWSTATSGRFRGLKSSALTCSICLAPRWAQPRSARASAPHLGSGRWPWSAPSSAGPLAPSGRDASGGCRDRRSCRRRSHPHRPSETPDLPGRAPAHHAARLHSRTAASSRPSRTPANPWDVIAGASGRDGGDGRHVRWCPPSGFAGRGR